jgi:hypothetical protein
VSRGFGVAAALIVRLTEIKNHELAFGGFLGPQEASQF